MKIPLSWLTTYLDTTLSVTELAHLMTMIGIEVESIHDPAKALQGFVVGEVIACAKHPDADRLNVTVVDTGREKLNVVCGAPNCRLGIKGVFAPAGSYIPGTDITLKKAMIRGAESNGMLCSEKELELSDESNGIIELPLHFKNGHPAADALGLTDPVINISITPNRGDHAAIYGVARDLAAAGAGTLKAITPPAINASFPNPIAVSIADPAQKAAPLFIGRMIKGIKNQPSPPWLQHKLKSAGLKPISAAVDVTNFFNLAYGRPLHVFDAAKIKGNIHVRFAQTGESLNALNDKTYALTDDMIAVCDDTGVLGLGGIIGGASTACTLDTTDIYLECALFNPSTIARTGRLLQINTDARYRFERGIDPLFAEMGINLATAIILELCGGEASTLMTAGTAQRNPKEITFNPVFTAKLTGVHVSDATQKTILRALGFAVDDAKTAWTVTAPSWRHDVDGEADLVEEIIRIHGFDHIKATLPQTLPSADRLLPDRISRTIAIRHALAARGLHETITWSFMDESKARLFGTPANDATAALTLKNPISSELGFMRPTTVANLLDAALRNDARGYLNCAFFEIGNNYHSTLADGHVLTATVLRKGFMQTRHWRAPARKADLYDAKADAESIFKTAGFAPSSLQITRDVPAYYHPGRAGAFKIGNVVVGYFGELHPNLLVALKADDAIVATEIFLEKIPAVKNKATTKKKLDLPDLQPLTRDFAFLVKADVEGDKIARTIALVDRTLITNVTLFDIYQGKGVPDGFKSVALCVTLQPQGKSLSDADIDALSQKIITAVKDKTGGTLRSAS
jgi:phenylalanyl-tRNA synthetase beta chain